MSVFESGYEVMRNIKGYQQSAILLLSFLGSFSLYAAVSDVTVTDVTTRAFSVVWVSDEAVTAASVRVYSDIGRETELSGLLTINIVSPALALSNGIAKIDVTGLEANTRYYIEGTPYDKEQYPSTDDAWLGLTCANCHT